MKIAVVLMLVALTPLKGVAALTVGFCGAGHTSAEAQASSFQHGMHQESGQQPDSSACTVCAEHCANASFVSHARSELSPLPQRNAAAAGQALLFAGFILERLDRPPLSL